MEQLIIQEKRAPNYILLELTGPITSYTFAEFEKKPTILFKNRIWFWICQRLSVSIPAD